MFGGADCDGLAQSLGFQRVEVLSLLGSITRWIPLSPRASPDFATTQGQGADALPSCARFSHESGDPPVAVTLLLPVLVVFATLIPSEVKEVQDCARATLGPQPDARVLVGPRSVLL